jgi:cell division protein FtsL
MTRLNLILFFALIFSALGLVNSQHKARNLYIELEQSKQSAKQIEQEYGQLQLEQSTWAMHSRIEQIATQQMQMQVPDAKRVQVVSATQIKVSANPIQDAKPRDMQTQDVQPKVGAAQ